MHMQMHRVRKYIIYIYMYIVSTLGVIPIFKVWKLRDERLRQPTSVY